jgi:predicted dehydrogenase
MICAANAAGVVLFHAEFNRTLPASIRAKALVTSGRIGRLIGLQATFAYWQGGRVLTTPWRYDPSVAGGGQLLDSGIHAVDLLRNIGGDVHSVSCVTTRFREELGGEDSAIVTIRFADGHLGSLYSTQACGMWAPTPLLAAYGTEGVITVRGPHGALALHRHDLPNRVEVIQEARDDIFAPMIDAFLRTVIDHAPNPSPAEEGRANLQFVLAAYESERLGREIELANWPAA